MTHLLASGPTYLFLDTEWADAAAEELVSLALVSADGTLTFYAERESLPSSPTRFVQDVVYPLLERGEVALPDIEFTTALRQFLGSIPQPYVLADHPNDLKFLRRALRGFVRSAAHPSPSGIEPEPVMTCMDRSGLTTMLLEDWFAASPDAAARRHHALVDAQALRMAWLAATRRIRADWARLGAHHDSSP